MACYLNCDRLAAMFANTYQIPMRCEFMNGLCIMSCVGLYGSPNMVERCMNNS
eukprot:m.187101 g.187101  ORF g.187101 m.187101 type:complete len:53 (-) comp18495_c0_seq30:1217-1375(-)